jgi:serine phosphatase RsbU (regulator of sigma subunit)
MAVTSPQRTGADAFSAVLALLDEAVLVFDRTGAVLRANRAAGELFCSAFAADAADELLVGTDVKDLFYASDLTRAPAGTLPFAVDGGEACLEAKLLDGSFVPVRVRCAPRGNDGPYLLVARVDHEGEALRERENLLAELRSLSRRLRGTLSIVSCASLGEGSFEQLVERVANELQRVLAADVASLYLADDYGFTPYGVSEGFERMGIDRGYLPSGLGVPALVAHNRRTTRLQLVSPVSPSGPGAVMLDLDDEERYRVRTLFAERCSTIVGTPVFSYGRVSAVVVVGWSAPTVVSPDDVALLDTVAGYLSGEFSVAVTQLEQRRAERRTAALAEVRDAVRTSGGLTAASVARIVRAVEEAVPSCVSVVEGDACAEGSAALHVCGVEGPARPVAVGVDELFAEGGDFAELGDETPRELWPEEGEGPHSGYAVLLSPGDGEDAGPRIALLATRRAGEHPFDLNELAFLRGLAGEVRAALDTEQERAHDAEIARALQAGLRNELPEAAGVTTASLYISATASAVVGGDFFDLHELPDGRVVVVMGDVSGKGVEAAATASLIKTALAAYAWSSLDPAGMLAALNNLLLNFSRLETFASLVVVSIDLAAGVATYCSAGHPPAMLVHRPGAADAELELLTVQSPIVGAFADLSYENGTAAFAQGDLVYLYTDGTTEARDRTGAFFGEDMLRETLLRACKAGVDQVPSLVYDEVRRFAGAGLHDDMAMVAVRIDEVGAAEMKGAVG